MRLSHIQLMHPNIKDLGVIHIAFPLKNLNSYQNVEYMMLVSYQSQPLASFLKQMNQNQEEYIQAYIEDGSGEIILHTQGDEYMGDFFRRLSGRKCINGSDRTNCKL